MQYLIVISFVIVYLEYSLSLGFTDISPLYTHFTYMFQHASVLHLVMNSLMFVTFYRVFKKPFLIVPLVIIAFLASFLCEHSLPTVGASGMIYVMIGMYLSEKRPAMVYVSVVAAFAISYFGSSNTLLHFICLASGIVYWYIIKFSEQYRKDINYLNEK